MMMDAVHGLQHGFLIATQPVNLLWCFVGVLAGNVIGVLPGMGIMATMSLLLPLTYSMSPVAATLMLSGIYYGAQYGGAISAILLNLPIHANHAVTCLDGFPMTLAGRGAQALGVSVLASGVGAAIGIIEMIFVGPFLVTLALQIGPADICAAMLLGLTSGATLTRGSPLKGVAMTALGLLLGLVGTDINTGVERYTFGLPQLTDGVDIVALVLGLFSVSEFIARINRVVLAAAPRARIRIADMMLGRTEVRRSLPAALRGAVVGSICSLVPGSGPAVAPFAAYALEKKIAKPDVRLGTGMVEGIACAEAATHSSVQGDFIPTMSLGIPGDAVMALILSALIIQGVTPGPQLIAEHPEIFWGLIASFWVGNVLLLLLNVPMIGIWIRLLSVPPRYLYPSALFFVCIGVYSTSNSFAAIEETAAIGAFGYVLRLLGFAPAPLLLGFVLGPRVEENFRRALLIGHGDISVFVREPTSAVLLAFTVALIAVQVFFHLRRRRLAWA
jgi:putative tricarboxylic transport membrane protein